MAAHLLETENLNLREQIYNVRWVQKKFLFFKIYLFKITNSFYTFKTWRSEVLNLREKLHEYSVVYGKTPIV